MILDNLETRIRAFGLQIDKISCSTVLSNKHQINSQTVKIEFDWIEKIRNDSADCPIYVYNMNCCEF